MFNLPYVPSSQELIDKAFARGRKKAKIVRSKRGPKYDRVINAELTRIDTVGNIIINELESIIKLYPSYDQLPPFYQKLLDLKIDKNNYKKTLGLIQGAIKVAKTLKKQAIAETKKNLDPTASKKYLGKTASLMKKIAPALNELRNIKDTMKSFPTIKQKPTLVIAGYPNVGKSTITKNLTKSNIKTAWYPFTTTQILIGYAKINHNIIQIIDTPGLLDRPITEKNKTEKQALLAIKELGEKILYVVEPSTQLTQQYNLYQEIKNTLGLQMHITLNIKKNTPEEKINKAKKLFNTSNTINALDKKECNKLLTQIYGK